MKKVAFYTLGCKVNQVETEQLKEEFINRGYNIVDFTDNPDIYIINTCTVTHVSDRKSRAMIRRAARNSHALVAITGCMAQVASRELADIEGIDLIVGNLNKDSIADIIENVNPEQKKPLIINQLLNENRKIKPVLYSCRHERTRAFVKIQDGCQSNCSYCIIPQARGPVRSKEPYAILQEIKQLTALGYLEIVLTGIHIGFYGIDLKGWDLKQLLDMILNETGEEYRIRLGSLEPLEVSSEIINLIAGTSRMCRHLHIPLQSGSNKILQAMNRRYSREYYYELLQEIAAKVPGVALTADVMVGFPSEDEKEFNETYNLIESLPLTDLHVFPYSRRPGTKAAAMTNQVSPSQKHARSQKILELAQKKHQDFINSHQGKELTILVEKKIAPQEYTGLSDNYIEVLLNSSHELYGKFVRVKMIDNRGEIIEIYL